MAKSIRDLLAEAKKQVHEVSVQDVKQMIENQEDMVLVDVREKDEYANGYIDGAVYVGRGMLEFSIENHVPNKQKKVVLYCARGNRSALAGQTLQTLGYANVYSMAGGFLGWKDQGLSFVQDKQWSPEQLSRYSRHFALREIGDKGQRKLLESKVLLVGAGGLGSPSAIYLAAAGVGTLGIIDSDVVDVSNLQRQIIHSTANVGKPKAESAKEMIAALNPDVKVIPYNSRLTAENILELVREYDVVVDGSDNFVTKYMVNDAAYMAGKPSVFGSIFQFDGQVSVFQRDRGPCYRCLFPVPPPPGLVPS